MIRRTGTTVTAALWLALGAGLVSVAAVPLTAQVSAPQMSPEQFGELLRQRPDLLNLVRQRIQQSGLDANTIRSRLQAGGLQGDLLDALLAGAPAGSLPPSADMGQAIALLGLSFTRQDTLVFVGDTVAVRFHYDSLRADSLNKEDSLARVTGKLRLFGLSVFRQPTTQFQPLVLGPMDDNYLLGPGDVLVLILTGAVELAHTLEITREGFFVMPRVGRVYANNLTLRELRSVLYDRLGRVYSGVTRSPDAKTRFDVTVALPRVNTVRVAGDVPRPGSYQVAATGSVHTALYQAGGLTERSNFRAIEVRRGAELVATVDLYEYLLRGVVRNDIPLQSGDVIFVPIRGGRVRVTGEVNRPAIYELMPGETLRDAIKMAGGLTPLAATDVATISRILPPEQRTAPGRTRTVLTVSLDATLDSATPQVPLFAGDSITIFSIQGPPRNAVTIRGGVWQPGTYSFEPGTRLSNLLRMSGGLKPESYEGRVQILRLSPDSVRRLIGVALSDGTPRPAEDPPLQEFDEVTVYSKLDFRPERYVTVNGAVNQPGRFTFADSITLRDAILLAGGPTEGAYLAQAEISRLRPSGGAAGDSLALILRVPLDSSYLADGTGPDGPGGAPTVVLQPHDQVFLRMQPDWELQRNVQISGEVRFPGAYTLTRTDERLHSIIERAGGLTPEAYPNGIHFYRSRNQAGRLPLDFHSDNLVLEPADSIHIPRFVPVVRVEGAVQAPANVTYRQGAGMDYYVGAAGGYTAAADKGRAYVLQPNGLVEKRGRPEPGAVIQVPQKPAGTGGLGFVTIMGALAPLISAITTIAVVIVTK